MESLGIMHKPGNYDNLKKHGMVGHRRLAPMRCLPIYGVDKLSYGWIPLDYTMTMLLSRVCQLDKDTN